MALSVRRRILGFAPVPTTTASRTVLVLRTGCIGLSFFKRNGVKFWLIFWRNLAHRYVLGRYGKTPAETDQKRLLEAAIESIQSDSGIVMPLDMPIELLSQGRSGNGSYESYLTL